MKVKELIAVLKKVDPNLEIGIDTDDTFNESLQIDTIANVLSGDGVDEPYLSIKVY